MTDFTIPHPPSSKYSRVPIEIRRAEVANFTAAGWLRLGDGSAPDHLLHIYDASADAQARIETGKTNGAALVAFENDARGWQVGIGPSDDLLLYDETAAATRLAIDTAGDVGIGTTSPSSRLHVKAAGGATDWLEVEVPSADNVMMRLRNSARAYDVELTGAGNFILNDVTAASNPLIVAGGAPTNALTIASSGNVGLGVATAGAPLEIALPTNNLEIVDATTTGGNNGNGVLSVRAGGAARTISFD